MKGAVLFVCLGNACRSIMAEALTVHYWNNAFEAASAGIRPLGYIPDETLQVLQELGVSTRGLRSKGLHEVDLRHFPLIVQLASHTLEGLLAPTFKGRIIHWRVRDPYQGSIGSFRRVRDTLEWLVTTKLPAWMEKG